MTPETKFHELETRAMVHLRRSPDLDEASVIVLIWRYPAFEPYQSWSLVKDEDRWLIRRTTWDHPTDYQRASDPLKQAAFMIDRDPAPTIEIVDVRTSTRFAEQIVERVSGLPVPSPLASDWVGADGAMNGIETQRGEVHVEWWCEGPPDWRVFTEEVERLRLELDAVVGGASST
jgi:hypothetical protein